MTSKFTKLDSPEGFDYYSLSNPQLPENTFVVRHQSFRDVLYHLETAGIELQGRMEKAGCAFARAINDLALSKNNVSRDKVVELVILSGGLFYNLNHGFKKTYGFSLPQCFMGIQRVRLDGEGMGRFTARVSYENFESLPDRGTIVIGDTVATGATLLRGLQHVGDVLEEKGMKVEGVVFATLAGSVAGGSRLLRAHRHLEMENVGLKSTYIAAEQIFHLMPDGTDLRFAGKNALAPPETIAYTKNEYGDWLAEHMKCAVLDWGTRCKNPLKHYKEFEHVANDLLKRAPDEKSKAVLNNRLEEMRREMKAYSGKIA